MRYLWSFLGAIVVMISGWFLFKKIKMLDKPGSDLKNTRKPVPTILGIFVYIAVIGLVALLFPEYLKQPLFLGLMLGSLPIVIIQFIDELAYLGKVPFEVPAWLRLISHIAGGILAVWIGQFGPQELLLGSYTIIIPTWAFTGMFVLWSILCINAINRFDGIYAQASGVSAIGFLTIFLLLKFIVFTHYTEFLGNSFEILTMVQNLSFILFAVSLVSTVIEFKPLGLVRDVGIMFFGFSLAYLAVAGGAKIGTIVVTLSLVIFDAIWVGLRRIFVMKKSPLKGDYTHLHHRFLGLGWTRPEARATVWIWSLVMMIFILLQGTDRIDKVIIFGVMALLFFGINFYLFVVKKLPCGLAIKKEA